MIEIFYNLVGVRQALEVVQHMGDGQACISVASYQNREDPWPTTSDIKLIRADTTLDYDSLIYK